MSSIWLNLFWREWREHQWKLLALCSVVFALVLATMPDRLQDWGGAAVVLAWMLSAPFGLFIGAGVAAGENSRGTMSYTQAQPVGLWRVGLTKLLVGGVVATLPGVLAVLFFWGLDRWGGLISEDLAEGLRWQMGMSKGVFSSAPALLIAVTIVTALSTYLWSAALGVNSRDEVRAAVWSVGALGAWTILLVAFAAVGDSWRLTNRFTTTSYLTLTSLGPLGPLAALTSRVEVNGIEVVTPGLRFSWLMISLLVHVALAAIFVTRYGRPLVSGTGNSQPAVSPLLPVRDFLAPPRRSRAVALAWKELRECGPLVLAGIGGCLLFGLTVLVVALVNGEGDFSARGRRELALFLVAPVVYVAPLVAVIVGLGATLRDLSPSLNTFWRSRPIDADQAFWVPAATGVATLAVCFVLPALLVVWWVQVSPWTLHNEVTIGWVGTGAAALLLFFSTGACFAAATRNAIYAAILSLGVSLTAVVWLGELFDDRRWITELWQMNLALLALGTAALLAAWAIYRADWPVRG
ncbi:hypothetical protein KOR34_30570 [Posidoniimonas corsicana]|uniref:ABC-2 family transporter protein n=1 Tax=Posidoniimonas corsicana TaxID=1938618 RepID=A0A5C5VJM6_9BACT|nr:hypothetical protein [Posidoniimonas corsicana]TWT38089.1 hypothetical protein KOR34_30570 [Posidoniimonas corsicana]